VSQRQSFSALQRAENSSMHPGNDADWIVEVFQCSSASRKFLNLSVWVAISPARDRFSALQRAENSSMRPSVQVGKRKTVGFSALQRAENSSIDRPHRQRSNADVFQCSSASRKFLNGVYWLEVQSGRLVSVLFSEPKIPQFQRAARYQTSSLCFSALQRAENSSIRGDD